MCKFFVALGAQYVLILSFLLFVPFHLGRIFFEKICEYLSDIGYKADKIIEDWGRSDEK